MGEITFEAALADRTNAMTDACTRCGKCVAVCPSIAPAGLAEAEPVDVINGIIDIIRGGPGSEDARQWARSCVLSGACIKACDDGVNPRFLLAMARLEIAKSRKDLPTRRRDGLQTFRQLNRDVTVLSHLQLTAAELERLGQRAGRGAKATETEEPDFIFYTGCNVLKTPHIALLALDIMDELGASYKVLGGPSHCCGVGQMRAGDIETSGRVTTYALDDMAQSKSKQVVAWCPSCFVQFTETTLPVVEQQRGARPFEMTPFMRYLADHLDALRPMLRERVELRVALHKHPGVPGVVEAAETLLRAIPGVELVDLEQPAVGLQSIMVAALPAYRRELQQRELEAAEAAGIDALAAVYHSDYRELCAHERDWPFRILNVLDLVAASMGLHQDDDYKRLKLMQDADAIVADCHELIEQHKLNAGEAREIVTKAMLADQPLPLRGSGR